ncbi:transglycosylase family protein [Streptomyces sp. NPDC055952]|uniref:LysM peptidoglycan-binding domain-containing protein n=1 Tax=Streptomyces sp. NPDC055952 TaxID=3345663 RepID=UPI0035DD9BF9
MLSGNGRHRRPRQAPALLVAAGVTGSAIAIPLLGASGASAADGTTWDRIADCETGGAWSQNSGNGYFGGLALSQEDWESYGGLDYAPSADLASRSQQIAVAERILADQGAGAWHTCGLLSGLEKGSSGESDSSDESAPTDSRGLLDSPQSSRSSATPSPSATSPSSSPSGAASSDTPSASPDETANSDKSPGSRAAGKGSGGSKSATPESDASGKSRPSDGSSAAADTGSGRHRGPSADESAESADARAGGSSGRHASRGEEASEEQSEGAYIVGVGDSLWSIADSLRIDGGWDEFYDGDEKGAGSEPDLVLPGQTLTAEDETDGK